MPEYRCQTCGKPYKSKSRLRRHLKESHRDDPATTEGQPLDFAPAGLPGPVVPMPATADKGLLGYDLTAPTHDDPIAHPPAKRTEAQMNRAARDALNQALRDLGLTRADLLSFRVTPTEVVLIQGPGGYKRIWPRKE